MPKLKSLALYIHWPFCLSKCPYCDFNSHVRKSIDEDLWEEALLKELDQTIAIVESDYEGLCARIRERVGELSQRLTGLLSEYTALIYHDAGEILGRQEKDPHR